MAHNESVLYGSRGGGGIIGTIFEKGNITGAYYCTYPKFSVQGVQTRLKRNDRFEISDRVAN